ncbi:peroxiredoxin [Haliangium ochraceum]|uniref:Glutathione-dependent peroxiredoxin n=1 Tax=Haliangium ochraceum (strain DSM 14365 / JCM 11303 / SMP-2) TaxID=502025 RepID=D0LWG4_HALO1|nr:peroxiredoxin [Haliangium ochraceum]ACY17614.1 Redoxin domain protein [Haliangium ochraceum DSM 14365]
MSISVGDKFPSVTVKHLTAEGLKELSTDTLFSGKKVVLFAVPGAFTPSCSKTHLPGYVNNADELKGKGVDEIVCMAVNDPFVMDAWAEQQSAKGKVTMLPDGNGELTEKLGLGMDGSGAGLGTRCKRFSMLVEDGVIKSLDVEEKASDVSVSGAESCLANLG